MSVVRWEKRLRKLGLGLRVLERGGGDGPVESWLVFVEPPSLPSEPLYQPPIGVGSDVSREVAIRTATADCVAKLASLAPEARVYFEDRGGRS
jgi:hypothetical protein